MFNVKGYRNLTGDLESGPTSSGNAPWSDEMAQGCEEIRRTTVASSHQDYSSGEAHDATKDGGAHIMKTSMCMFVFAFASLCKQFYQFK